LDGSPLHPRECGAVFCHLQSREERSVTFRLSDANAAAVIVDLPNCEDCDSGIASDRQHQSLSFYSVNIADISFVANQDRVPASSAGSAVGHQLPSPLSGLAHSWQTHQSDDGEHNFCFAIDVDRSRAFV
jgi:hypothetical protein